MVMTEAARGPRVIRPGKWWIVRLRWAQHHEGIARFLACTNGHRAGHSGDRRRYTMKRVNGQRKNRKKVYRPRQWELRGIHGHTRPYRFADLSDAKSTARNKLIQVWMKENDGILEIIEVDGCLHTGVGVSEKLTFRRFHTTNAMRILALECALGD